MNADDTARVAVSTLGTSTLLAAYGDILDELNARRVVRTRNAPAGDLAETLAMLVYQGELAPNSKKSWDVQAVDGRLVQVKALVVPEGKRGGNFSVFRTVEGFDLAVFVTFTHDYKVRAAVEVSARYVADNAIKVEWVNGHRIAANVPLANAPDARDLTTEFRHALTQVDTATASVPVY